jgi:hypothetical protein
VSAVVIFTGFACGTLLTAVGLVLWGGFHQVAGLSDAVRVLRWLAGGLLLIGAALAGYGDRALATPLLCLALMAALAAPPGIRRGSRRSHGSPISIVPALLLTGLALFSATQRPAGFAVTEMGGRPSTWVGLAMAVCGGLGARALGAALGDIVNPPVHTDAAAPGEGEGPEAKGVAGVTYAALTVLMGVTAVLNLWQQGTMWVGARGEGGLAGVWLAWSAAWLGQGGSPRLRAGLTALAALLLVVVVVAVGC